MKKIVSQTFGKERTFSTVKFLKETAEWLQGKQDKFFLLLSEDLRGDFT